jgi:hypothetical protein
MPKHRVWWAYYLAFIKQVGKECWHTWRGEVLASAITLACLYAISPVEVDVRSALLATAYTVGAFVLWHTLRVPWLLYSKLDEADHLKSIWLVIGSVFLGGTCLLIGSTAAYLYTMQPRVIVMVPVPTLQNQRIAQLESQIKSPFQESKDSLRRRTMRTADEISDFLRKRFENHPAYAYPQANDPSPTDERKAAIKKCQDYDQATADGYMRRYKDAAVGIIKEYEARGVPVGYLEKVFSQQVPVWAPPGSVWEDNPQNNLWQFRELAFHVTADNQRIDPTF